MHLDIRDSKLSDKLALLYNKTDRVIIVGVSEMMENKVTLKENGKEGLTIELQ